MTFPIFAPDGTRINVDDPEVCQDLYDQMMETPTVEPNRKNYIMEVLLGYYDGSVRFQRRNHTLRFYKPTKASTKRLETVLANEIDAGRADISFRLPLIFVEITT